MNHLIAQGKIFYWGTSEWDAEAIQEAIGVSKRLGLIGPLTEQPQYSLLHRRRVEQEYAPICKKHGLGLMTFSPLTSGLLSGKYRDGNVPESRFDISGMWTQFEAGEGVQTLEIPDSKSISERLVKLQAVADEAGIKMSHLSLAWILKNPNVDSVLLGASKVEQLTENLGALQIVEKLTPELMSKIEDAARNAPKPATPHLSYAKMMQDGLVAANQAQQQALSGDSPK
jgi:aryl-alcohol dehydrogenase-like predicted oxidoreductase